MGEGNPALMVPHVAVGDIVAAVSGNPGVEHQGGLTGVEAGQFDIFPDRFLRIHRLESAEASVLVPSDGKTVRIGFDAFDDGFDGDPVGAFMFNSYYAHMSKLC